MSAFSLRENVRAAALTTMLSRKLAIAENTENSSTRIANERKRENKTPNPKRN